MQITIVRRPIGEAPAWVRDAWIGLSLPLAAPDEQSTRGFGVLSMPHTRLGQLWAILRGKSTRLNGYYVNASLAVALLEKVRPDAAKWWRDNAAGILEGGHYLIFDTPATERLERD